jgi:hypothetical protein
MTAKCSSHAFWIELLLTTGLGTPIKLSAIPSRQSMESSLVAEAILSTAIRTLPGDPVAGHAPDIFFHTFLADTESTSAFPTKRKFFPAAMTDMLTPAAIFSSIGGSWFDVIHGCRFTALLIYTHEILMQTATHVNADPPVIQVFTISIRRQ